MAGVRKPWASKAAARAAVVRQCEVQFVRLFGRPFDAQLRTKLLAEFTRLKQEDADARAVFTGGRVRRAAALTVLRRHGLDPGRTDVLALEGHAPVLGALYLEYLDVTSDGRRRTTSVSDLKAEFRPPSFKSPRDYVLARFEALHGDSEQPLQEQIAWNAGASGRSLVYLTNHELAVVSVLIDPTVVRPTDWDVENGTARGVLLDRERRTIRDMRRILGDLRTRDEQDAAQRERPTGRPLLPSVRIPKDLGSDSDLT